MTKNLGKIALYLALLRMDPFHIDAYYYIIASMLAKPKPTPLLFSLPLFRKSPFAGISFKGLSPTLTEIYGFRQAMELAVLICRRVIESFTWMAPIRKTPAQSFSLKTTTNYSRQYVGDYMYANAKRSNQQPSRCALAFTTHGIGKKREKEKERKNESSKLAATRVLSFSIHPISGGPGVLRAL